MLAVLCKQFVNYHLTAYILSYRTLLYIPPHLEERSLQYNYTHNQNDTSHAQSIQNRLLNIPV